MISLDDVRVTHFERVKAYRIKSQPGLVYKHKNRGGKVKKCTERRIMTWSAIVLLAKYLI